MKSDFIEIVICDYQTHFEAIRSVRDKVFVKEQSVPIDIEIDGLDEKAIHVVVVIKGSAIATGRMLEDGHIGRIAVLNNQRGKGIGRLIMQKFLEHAKEQKLKKVWLSSQWHAHRFYCNLGFVCIGEKYQEAGIDHIKMTKSI